MNNTKESIEEIVVAFCLFDLVLKTSLLFCGQSSSDFVALI